MATTRETAFRRANPDLLTEDEHLIAVVAAMPDPMGLSMSARLIGINPAEEPPTPPMAADIPRRTRFAVITDRRVLFLTARTGVLRARPGAVLTEMSQDQIEHIRIGPGGHSLDLEFSDGSTSRLTADNPDDLVPFASAK